MKFELLEPSAAFSILMQHEAAKTEAYRAYQLQCEIYEQVSSDVKPALRKGLYNVSGMVRLLSGKGFSHRQIASHVGCSPSSVSRWRNGNPCKFKALRRFLTIIPSEHWSRVTQVR